MHLVSRMYSATCHQDSLQPHAVLGYPEMTAVPLLYIQAS